MTLTKLLILGLSGFLALGIQAEETKTSSR